MKILVFSDSHRYMANMRHIVEKHGNNVGCVLHLGDGCEDALQLSRLMPEVRFEWVRGNCDYSFELAEKLLTLEGKKLLMTHGHKYHVKSDYQRIVYAALEREVDACFFGHSHQPAVFYENGIFFMNPGSISLPRAASLPSYGVVDISESGVGGEWLEIDSSLKKE